MCHYSGNTVLSATGYRLDVATDGAFASILPAYNNLDAGNLLNLAVSGLAQNTPYYYRVRAYNASGNGADSNVITLTTLQVHTVTFTGSAGGWLSGTLTQTIDHGGDGSPVTANANDGYHFTGWSGTGGFSSGDNPLTVTNVLTDMIITASFANAAPLVRIVEPVQNQSVWGTVAIRAEASDDMAVQSIQFYVDGAAPITAAFSAAAAGKDDAALQLQSGELNVDFQGADILMLDAQSHLRKANLHGGLQAVVGNDLPLRDMALTETKRVHLIFMEPLRLDDGQNYSWVLCDLKQGAIRGIAGTPAQLLFATQAPLIQFDAQGNGYYFRNDNNGAMTLVRQNLDPLSGLYADAAAALYTIRMDQQVREWLVLPDGTVLLALFQPQTARLAYFKIGAEKSRVVGFEGGFETVLQSAAVRTMDSQEAGTLSFKVQGERLLTWSGTALAMSAWPALRWENYALPAIEIADMAVERNGNLFVAGSDPISDAAGLWSVNMAGSELLAPLPLPCRRIAILHSAPEKTSSPAPASLTSPQAAAAAAYSCDWNTLLYVNGEHRLSAVASDAAGATARDEIVVRVANVVLSLSAQRFSDHGWLIKKNYIKVLLSVDNSGGAPVAKYVVYRRINNGSEEIAKEFQPGEVQNGLCEFIEAAASGNPATSYRAAAMSADGMIIGASAVVTI